MIKLFIESVSTTTNAQASRDLRSLEDQVNEFIKNPQVLPVRTDLNTFDDSGTRQFVVILDYNIKQGG